MAVEQPDDSQAESQGCADVRTVIAAALFTVAIQFSTAGWNSGKKTAGTVANKRLFPLFFCGLYYHYYHFLRYLVVNECVGRW
jgi:hypothetical protein